MWALLLIPSLCLVASTQGSSWLQPPSTTDAEWTWPDYSPCEEGFEPLPDHDRCIKVVDDKRLSWNAAMKYCDQQYSNLAMVFNHEMYKGMKDMLKRGKRYWIGVSRAPDSSFEYIYGVTMHDDFQPWARGEPNNRKKREDCVEMIANGKGAWNTKRCNKKRSFICEAPIRYAKK